MFVTFFSLFLNFRHLFLTNRPRNQVKYCLSHVCIVFILFSFPISRAGDASLCFRSPLKPSGRHTVCKAPNCDCMSIKKTLSLKGHQILVYRSSAGPFYSNKYKNAGSFWWCEQQMCYFVCFCLFGFFFFFLFFFVWGGGGSDLYQIMKWTVPF